MPLFRRRDVRGGFLTRRRACQNRITNLNLGNFLARRFADADTVHKSSGKRRRSEITTWQLSAHSLSLI